MSIAPITRNPPPTGQLDEAMLGWSRGDRAAGELLVDELYPGLHRGRAGGFRFHRARQAIVAWLARIRGET